MAGKRLGTVFVELGLDSKEFTKGEAQILKQAQSTGIEIEKGWRTLGSHSDMIFNAMRTNAINAQNAILNNTKSSLDEIRRAKESAAAKIKSIDEQQYGHQAGIIGTLKAHWIEASVAIGAAWMVVGQAMEYVNQGAKALQVESSFKIMAEASGVNSEKMIENMKRLTRSTIEESDMMQKAIKLMTLGYNPEQIERFSSVVHTAAMIAGTTDTEAYERLADAIANRMPKALVQMGAVTKEQMKIVNSAIEGGADSVALYELAMANLELKTRMLQGTQDAATISVQQFNAQCQETKETLGKWLIVGFQKLSGVLQGVAGFALSLSMSLFRLMEASNSLLGNNKQSEYWRVQAQAAQDASDELYKRSVANMYGEAEVSKKATTQEIKNAQDKVKAQLDALRKYKDGKANIDKEAEAEERRKQAAHELSVDLWIKDEARKWEELDKYYADEDAKAKKRADRANSIVESMMTPQEKYNQTIEELSELYNSADLSLEQYQKAISVAGKTLTDATKTQKEEMTDLQKTIEGWGRDSADALVDFVTRGKRSFKDFVDSCIKDMLRMMVYQNMMKPLFNSISNGSLWTAGLSMIGSIFGGGSGNGSMYAGGQWNTAAGEFNGGGLGYANGGAFMNGQVLAFANGGIVDRPTLFPMARGAGLMGENGPEAVIPLKRNANGRLGVEGGGSTINVPITVNGASNKKMIAELQSEIEDTVVKVIRRHS